MSSLVQVDHLTKRFKEITAVNDLSFGVQQGEIFGFLGQNGAGKSTTIRMLLTLIAPTSGSITVFNKSLQSHRSAILQQVGAIIEKPDLYTYLTALQNVKLMAQLSGCNKTESELLQQLEMVGLGTRARSKVKTFSQGMKQRLGIACALVHNPQLIILDEPTNGLDPQGIADIRNLILQLSKSEKKTIIISSHLLNEVEMIADSMLIIDKGKKIAEGKVSHLLNPANTIVELDTADNAATFTALEDTAWSKTMTIKEGKLYFRLHKNSIPELNRNLVQKNIDVISLRSKHSLEDYFLSLTTANNVVHTH